MLLRNFDRRLLSCLIASLMVVSLSSALRAQGAPDLRDTGGVGSVSLSDGVFGLNFSSTDPAFPAATAASLAATFFQVIGPESEYFNAYCPHEVNMIVENPLTNCGSTTIAACAYTDPTDPNLGYIRINGDYIDRAPQDWDLVTHETMHVVQDYPWGEIQGCMYWPEGLADFGRDRWGVNNPNANWSLPPPAAGQSYRGEYGMTAGFLRWIEQTWGPGPILTLHDWLTAGTCPGQDIWATQTLFPTIDALYENYLSGGDGRTASGPTTPSEPVPGLPPPDDTATPSEPEPNLPADPDPAEPDEPYPGDDQDQPAEAGDAPDEPEYPDDSE